jgi:PmbA protein
VIDEIKKSLSADVRWFDVFETKSESSPISFRNNRLHSVKSRSHGGVGVRVNRNGRTGISYSNDMSQILDVATRASDFSRFCDLESYVLPEIINADFEPYDVSVISIDMKTEVRKAETLIDAIRSRMPDLTVDMDVSISSGTTRIMNSRGAFGRYRSSYYGVSCSASQVTDDGRVDVSESRAGLSAFDYIDFVGPIIRRIEHAKNIRTFTETSLPVIMSPRAFARLLGILTSGLSAKSVYKGISAFEGKIGENRFNGSFTLIDDPLQDGSPYAFPFDDEGVPAMKKTLIDSGVISLFISDLKYSELMKIPITGNASRGYANSPSPSFSGIVIPPGQERLDAVMKSVKRGLFIESFIGLGQSNTLNGEFSANLELAYLIENGEICGRVKNCMINDNFFDMMAGDMCLSDKCEAVGHLYLPSAYFPKVSLAP